MRTRPLLLLLAALTIAPIVFAAHQADLYVIPVASRVAGVNGTFWRTDVTIQNFRTVPLNVTILFIQSGEGNPDNVANLVSTAVPTGSLTVPAGGTVVLSDVLNGFEGKSDGLSGALVVSADGAFAVTSRTYTTAESGGTFGQTVVPVRDFYENVIGDTNNTTSVTYVPGLSVGGARRSNLGFVAGAGHGPMVVSVTIKGATGTTLGTRTFTIPADQFVHVQVPAISITNAPFDVGSAEFRITSGDGVIAPYASIVDNLTGDAVYVNGIFPNNTVIGKFGPSLWSQLVERMQR